MDNHLLVLNKSAKIFFYFMICNLTFCISFWIEKYKSVNKNAKDLTKISPNSS